MCIACMIRKASTRARKTPVKLQDTNTEIDTESEQVTSRNVRSECADGAEGKCTGNEHVQKRKRGRPRGSGKKKAADSGASRVRREEKEGAKITLVDAAAQGLFFIERVVDSRRRNKKKQYLVKWQVR